MSTIFAIDSNNGFLISGGNATLVTGLDAVVINCQHEAQTLLGEDPFRQNKGMPNFQTVWGGTPNVIEFEASLRSTLLAVADVDSLSNFSATIDGDNLNYSIEINTIFGTATITG